MPIGARWTGRQGSKVAAIVERREKRDAQPSISHSIKQSMACGRQKEVKPKGQPADSWETVPKPQKQGRPRHKGTEDKGMGESPVAPEVTVSYAKLETDDIQVGQRGANCSNREPSFWDTRLAEESADAQGHRRMGKCRRQTMLLGRESGARTPYPVFHTFPRIKILTT